MNANREKTSSVLGLVVSVLLHAIFLAGCYAYDASTAIKNSTADPHTAQINPVADKTDHAQPKS
jgi:hypothetical protein